MCHARPGTSNLECHGGDSIGLYIHFRRVYLMPAGRSTFHVCGAATFPSHWLELQQWGSLSVFPQTSRIRELLLYLTAEGVVELRLVSRSFGLAVDEHAPDILRAWYGPKVCICKARDWRASSASASVLPLWRGRRRKVCERAPRSMLIDLSKAAMICACVLGSGSVSPNAFISSGVMVVASFTVK